MVKKIGILLTVAGFLGWGAWNFLIQSPSSHGPPKLRVLAYSSFVAKWGAGPALKAEFEKTCNCIVDLIEAPDSVLDKMKMQGLDAYDVVLGFDQLELVRAQRMAWKTLKLEGISWEPQAANVIWESKLFPFDWGFLAFVKKTGSPLEAQSLDDLLTPEFHKKIILQDPRTSSAGLQFLYWVLQAKGEEAGFAYLEKLLPQVSVVSPSWSTSYGMFQEGVAPVVMSYSSSPLYHQIVEKKDMATALVFPDGHPLQIEFVGVPETCVHCDLAESFVQSLFSISAQTVIRDRNLMLPAITGLVDGTPFAELRKYKPLAVISSNLLERKEVLVERWKKIRRQ